MRPWPIGRRVGSIRGLPLFVSVVSEAPVLLPARVRRTESLWRAEPDVRLGAHPDLSARFVAISEADVPVAVSTGWEKVIRLRPGTARPRRMPPRPTAARGRVSFPWAQARQVQSSPTRAMARTASRSGLPCSVRGTRGTGRNRTRDAVRGLWTASTARWQARTSRASSGHAATTAVQVAVHSS